VDLLNICWGPLTRRTVIQLHRRLQNIRALCVIQICDLSARMVQDCIGLALCLKHCILEFRKIVNCTWNKCLNSGRNLLFYLFLFTRHGPLVSCIRNRIQHISYKVISTSRRNYWIYHSVFWHNRATDCILCIHQILVKKLKCNGAVHQLCMHSRKPVIKLGGKCRITFPNLFKWKLQCSLILVGYISWSDYLKQEDTLSLFPLIFASRI